jgi:bifunctional N-acetylglucosamine-1-phosphate-uridyltransferase/glucosamine-1-phosphate-acetyltransferase GlmU-like protein
LPDGEEDWDIEHIESEMYNPGIMNVPPMVMAEDMSALQQRMLHMEYALTRVIAYIENQSIQNQEFHPEDA